MEVSLVKEKEFLDFFIVKNGQNVGKSTASLEVGGSNSGLRPMEMFASSLAICASIDAVHILKKQRVELNHLSVHVTGERDSNRTPAVFKRICLEYGIKQEEHILKLTKAVNLSLNKYCSVRAMIKDEVKIETKISLVK